MFRASLALAAGLAYAARADEARSILAELTTSDIFVPAALFALIHIALGEFDQAFVYLDQAVAERSSVLLSAPSFSYWDPVRGDTPASRRFWIRWGLPG